MKSNFIFLMEMELSPHLITVLCFWSKTLNLITFGSKSSKIKTPFFISLKIISVVTSAYNVIVIQCGSVTGLQYHWSLTRIAQRFGVEDTYPIWVKICWVPFFIVTGILSTWNLDSDIEIFWKWIKSFRLDLALSSSVEGIAFIVTLKRSKHFLIFSSISVVSF